MFPTLTKMIHWLSEDNHGSRVFELPSSQWVWPANVQRLERQATKLTKEEQGALVCGEQSEQEQVVRTHGVQVLAEFMERVFDGDLTGCFYKK